MNRPRETVAVRRGACLLCAIIDHDQLGFDPGTGTPRIERGMTTQGRRDLRAYLRWSDAHMRWCAEKCSDTADEAAQPGYQHPNKETDDAAIEVEGTVHQSHAPGNGSV